jgi:hypothetical protein
VALFERHRTELPDTLAHCSSGRELEARGHHEVRRIAGQLDASTWVARFDGAAFVAS